MEDSYGLKQIPKRYSKVNNNHEIGIQRVSVLGVPGKEANKYMQAYIEKKKEKETEKDRRIIKALGKITTINSKLPDGKRLSVFQNSKLTKNAGRLSVLADSPR